MTTSPNAHRLAYRIGAALHDLAPIALYAALFIAAYLEQPYALAVIATILIADTLDRTRRP